MSVKFKNGYTYVNFNKNLYIVFITYFIPGSQESTT